MTLSEIRKIVSTDPETKNLRIDDADLLKVYQYLSTRDEPDQDGYEAVLLTEPYIEVVYRPSKERSDARKRARIRENLKFYDTEVYIQDASIEGFECLNEERKRVKELAVQFLKEYRPDRFSRGLYVYGRYASGKSYLISAIAQELAKRNVSVLFCYMPDLVRSIKQGMNEGNLEERVNQLKRADVLMLDDIGGENMSPWFRDEVLVPVMQYRLSASLPVFMTSNYDYIKLVDAMTAVNDEANRVKAARLVQRLRKLMVYVKLSAQEYPDSDLK
ncbi:MAG: ATP-binding protein [Acholeplasmataceae bacterium]